MRLRYSEISVNAPDGRVVHVEENDDLVVTLTPVVGGVWSWSVEDVSGHGIYESPLIGNADTYVAARRAARICAAETLCNDFDTVDMPKEWLSMLPSEETSGGWRVV